MEYLPTKANSDGTGTDLYYAAPVGMFTPRPPAELPPDDALSYDGTMLKNPPSGDKGSLHVALARIIGRPRTDDAVARRVPADDDIHSGGTIRVDIDNLPHVKTLAAGTPAATCPAAPAERVAETAPNAPETESPTDDHPAPAKENVIEPPAAPRPGDAPSRKIFCRRTPVAVLERKPLRIALATWETSGIGRGSRQADYFESLAHQLADMKHEVHVFTRWFAGEAHDEKKNGVFFHRIPHDLCGDVMAERDGFTAGLYAAFDTVGKRHGAFDVLQVCDWRTAGLIGRALEEKHVLAVTMFYDTEDIRTWGKPEGLSQRILEIEIAAIRAADRVIGAGRRTRENMEAISGREVSELSQTIDEIGNDMPDAGAVKAQFGIGALDPTVLFAGELCLATGPDILMKAIPDILRSRGDAKFVFVGDGEMLWPLKVMSRYMLLDHAVRIVGHLDNRAFREIMSAVDLVMLPTRNTDDTAVVLAAWQMAKPVIVTQNSPAPVKHEVNGLRCYDCENSIVWAVNQIFGDFEKGRELGRRGQRETGHFSRSNVAKAIENVYYAQNTQQNR